MTQHDEIPALAEIGRQFQIAARNVQPVPAPRRRLRRLALAAAALVAVTVPTVAVATDALDFGGATPGAGEPGGPPAIATPEPGTATVDVLSLVGRVAGTGVDALRRKVEPYGLRVEVRPREVADAAVGRVFGIQFPRRARFDAERRLVLERGSSGTIFITVGVRSDTPTTEGLTLYEVLPQVEAAVDRRDPAATGRRLEELGFAVTWRLIVENPARDGVATSATGTRLVSEPPEGTRILSVLNRDGTSGATKDTRALTIEIAPAGSAVLRDHP